MKEKILLYLIFFGIGFFLLGLNTAEAHSECYKYGSMAYYDHITKTCKCLPGYDFGKDFLGNISCISVNQLCQNQYGPMARYNSLYNKCECASGYLFGKNIFGETYCVSGDSICKDQYGSMAQYNSLSGKCECGLLYIFGKDSLGNTKCIHKEEWCRNKYGSNAKYNLLKDDCECKSGYELTIKRSGGLECVSCLLKYGPNSTYDSISGKCKCNYGYTLDENNQCVKKQNNVYFLLKELDLNNRKAVVKSEYDQKEYIIEYDYDCYDFAIQRYLNEKIVINLGTNFILERGNKVVLYNDNATCEIKSVKLAFMISSICESNYILQNNRCVEITCPPNAKIINNECFCVAGYQWNSSRTACIKTDIPEEKPTKPVQEQQIQQHQEEERKKPMAILGDEKEINDETQEVLDTEIKEETEALQEPKEQEEEKQDSPTLIRSILSAIRNFFSMIFNWF